MISVLAKGNEHSICSLEVKGHAGYAEYGKDIVCASVSTAVIMSINLIERFDMLDNISYQLDEGILFIHVNIHDEIIKRILDNLLYTLKDLEIQYPTKIKVKQ